MEAALYRRWFEPRFGVPAPTQRVLVRRGVGVPLPLILAEQHAAFNGLQRAPYHLGRALKAVKGRNHNGTIELRERQPLDSTLLVRRGLQVQF